MATRDAGAPGSQRPRATGRACAGSAAAAWRLRSSTAILMTAALCLLAFGAVMVYSASSPLGVLNGQGNGTGDFIRYLVFGAVGLVAMHVLERRGLALLNERRLPPAPVRRLRACSSSFCCPGSASWSTAPGAGSRPARSSFSPRS